MDRFMCLYVSMPMVGCMCPCVASEIEIGRYGPCLCVLMDMRMCLYICINDWAYVSICVHVNEWVYVSLSVCVNDWAYVSI